MSEQTTEFDESAEPAVLGAAATLPGARKSKGPKSKKPKQPRGRRRRSRESQATLQPDTGKTSFDGVESVFEPHRPAIPPLRPYLVSLWERRRFMTESAKAEIRGARSSTILGGLWGVMDPLFQAGIYYFLFTVIRRGSESGGRPIEFLNILVAGIFLFQLISAAFMEGGSSIQNGKGLMLNSAFPRAMLPITTVYKSLLKFLPSIPIYAVFHIALQAPVGWGLLMVPVLFFLQVILMLGIALLLSTVTVYMRDAKNVIQYITRLLFFATPIIYPVSLVGDYRPILSLQPLFPLFASYQEAFGGGMPPMGLVAQVAAWAFGFLLVGAWTFLRHERDFAIHL